MSRVALAAVLSALAWGCTGAVSEPRELYNEGLQSLQRGEFERAGELLLQARDGASGDGELRYRAAFNLGLAHAGRAEASGDDEPDAALEALRTSAAWLRDAVRLRPEDDDARANLELVLRRAQILADQLNRGENGLEARLDRAIDEQRGLRDELRGLAVELAAAKTPPDREAFETLATAARTLYADTGAVSDLAADELALLAQKPPDELTQEEAVRRAQLEAMDAYLQDARRVQEELRRALHRHGAEAAHEGATGALGRLVRAREQLLEPVEVLQAAAQAQLKLREHTDRLEAAERETIDLVGEDDRGPDRSDKDPKVGGGAANAPAWLTAAHLGGRQREILERTSEVAARFAAVTEGERAASPEGDPDAARALTAAAEARPALDRAIAAMEEAGAALDAELLAAAGDHERDALKHLAAAIERFSGLRGLIELAYTDQRRIVGLLDPDVADADLTTAERAEALDEALGVNIDRLGRMAELLELERQREAENAGEAGADEAALDARFEAAEEHRAAALEAAEELAALTDRARAGARAAGALELAETGEDEIEELRRLFFSIVAHLEDLHRRQGETHDRTAAAQGRAGDDLLAALGPAAESQREHATLAGALAEALAEQADEAARAEEPQAAAPAENLAAASEEVRAAAEAMDAAAQAMRDAMGDAETMSVDLAPALEDQPRARGHLEEAIRLLKPPPEPDEQDQDQEDQGGQDQDQQGRDDQQEQAGRADRTGQDGDSEKEQERQAQRAQRQQEHISREQARRRLRAIREREDQRRRERREAPAAEPVEKDW